LRLKLYERQAKCVFKLAFLDYRGRLQQVLIGLLA
jgi:hypothetical protein